MNENDDKYIQVCLVIFIVTRTNGRFEIVDDHDATHHPRPSFFFFTSPCSRQPANQGDYHRSVNSLTKTKVKLGAKHSFDFYLRKLAFLDLKARRKEKKTTKDDSPISFRGTFSLATRPSSNIVKHEPKSAFRHDIFYQRLAQSQQQ